MFKRTVIYQGVLLAIGGVVALPSLSLAADEPAQRIEITGSAIKRVNAEGPAPVEVLTRKDIAKTGATSLNELLKSIPSIDIFDQGELTSNSPSGSGTASVRLRGLSETDTLVLLNGRRLPVNALYDSSGAGAAFDINSLPIGAIERVEILKDGGSAIYGADAIAGVINFITKTDYQGAELSLNTGTSSRHDGTEKRFGFSGGWGDLEKDGVNILVGLDYLKRDPIYRKDRDISKSGDFRRFGATKDGRSSFSPYGNILDPLTGDFVGQSYRDCPPEDFNGRCRYDFNASLLTAYNGADRLSGLITSTVAVTPEIKGFAEMLYSTSKDTFLAHPVPDYFIVPIIDPSQRPYEIFDADGNGTNSIYIAGRFMQGGARTTKRKSDFLNLSTGLEGTNLGLDWKLSVSHGVSKVKNSDSNYYNANLWLDATSNGSLDPTVSTNDPALVQSLKVNPVRSGKSTLDSLNGQFSGALFKLDGGVSQYAIGVALDKEKLTDTPDALTQQGLVIGSIQQAAVSASRDSKAAFAELQLPFLKQLEGQLAIRRDQYPHYAANSPKVGVKFTPFDSLAFRASYTKSFKAPALKQLYGAQEEGAIDITDPAQCVKLGIALDANGECALAAKQVSGSNTALKPEKGRTNNVGVVFDVSSSLSGSVDFWKIRKTDEIAQPSIGSAIDQGLYQKVGAQYSIYTNLLNFAQREVSGVDVDARYALGRTLVGKVVFRNSLTLYTANKTRDESTSPWDNYLETYTYPKYRNSFVASTEMESWALTGVLRTVGGFYDSDKPLADAKAFRRVALHQEVDLQGQYSGFPSWDFTLGVKNVFDNMPPLSILNGTDNTYSQQGFAEIYSSRGRFFYLGVKYAFR